MVLNSDKLISIASCPSVAEANAIQAALADHNIEAVVDGQANNAAFGNVGPSLSDAKVLVYQRDASKAAEIVQATRDSFEAPRKDPWFCGKCLEEVDGGFEICWSCGNVRDEVETDFPETAERVEQMDIPIVETDSLGRETENPYESPRAIGAAPDKEQKPDPDEADSESRMLLGLLAAAACFMFPVVPALFAWFVFYSAFRKRLPMTFKARALFWLAMIVIFTSHLIWFWFWNFQVIRK